MVEKEEIGCKCGNSDLYVESKDYDLGILFLKCKHCGRLYQVTGFD